MSASRLAARSIVPGLVALASAGCQGEGLPDIPLKLSKNCNDVEVVVLAARVGTGEGEEVLDVAADGTLGGTAWVLVRRPSASGQDEVVVQRVAARGVEHETVLPASPAATLHLQPAPDAGEVWVMQSERGDTRVWRVAPDDLVRPVLGSSELSAFPSAGPPCPDCDDDWPRRLFFLPTGPALVALPLASADAALVVWVTDLDASGSLITPRAEHRLNFEPPCDDSTPEAAAYCEDLRMSLRYPSVSLLGLQQDPRQATTTLLGHRTRSQTYDGQPFPIESADVFMVELQVDAEGTPAGVLRSYADFYIDERPELGAVTPEPSALAPYGVAIDRVATYGLFTNEIREPPGLFPRLVRLPSIDPEFIEMTDEVVLPDDIVLLQLDRDIALGRLESGAWALTKLFPDDPDQSGTRVYETDAPIEEIISGGIGTFMLRKQDAPPEVVRLRCPEGGT